MEYNKFKSFYRQLLNNIFKFFLNLIPIRKLRAKLKAAWTKFHIKKYALIALDNYDESKIKLKIKIKYSYFIKIIDLKKYI